MMKINEAYPKRIVCLTEECTETLYLLNEEKRIIGISNYAVRPKRAREELASDLADEQYEMVKSGEYSIATGYDPKKGE